MAKPINKIDPGMTGKQPGQVDHGFTPADTATAPQYEYKSVRCAEDADIGEHGQDGWELRSTVPLGLDSVRHYFIRRKR